MSREGFSQQHYPIIPRFEEFEMLVFLERLKLKVLPECTLRRYGLNV
jgi:hypothetical protein